MKYHCGGLVLLMLVTGQGVAGQFAIQLEASRSPGLDQFQALSRFGRLYTETAQSGYIRTRLGPFANKAMALDVLQKVHAEGFTKAIVARHQDNANAALPAPAIAPNHRHDIDSFDVKTLKEWNLLTSQQQKNLVYLDGELHIKNGDEFTPLDEVISGD